MAAVQLESIDKHYGRQQALHAIDLAIADGEFAVFVGPSGCGKSTLLRCIAGLERTSAGRIRIGERDVTGDHPSDRGVAMVFQSYALYPHMTVRENMEFGMKINGVAVSERRRRVETAAGILQLGDYLERKPAALSGGQRQRVAIGRAIVRQPAVFLFDEPLSNLDARLRIQMRVELEALHRELGSTMIYVTHDQVEAMTMADRIVVLRDGRLEQHGRPMDLYRKPDTEFVAGFIGAPSMNLLPVQADEGELRLGDVILGRANEARVIARVGIRPEHVQIADGAPLGGTVRLKETLGGEAYLYVDVEIDGVPELVVRVDGETRIAAGNSIRLAFPPNRLHAFDRDGRRVALIAERESTR